MCSQDGLVLCVFLRFTAFFSLAVFTSTTGVAQIKEVGEEALTSILRAVWSGLPQTLW